MDTSLQPLIESLVGATTGYGKDGTCYLCLTAHSATHHVQTLTYSWQWLCDECADCYTPEQGGTFAESYWSLGRSYESPELPQELL